MESDATGGATTSEKITGGAAGKSEFDSSGAVGGGGLGG